MEIGVVVRADERPGPAAGNMTVKRHAGAAFQKRRAVPVNHIRINFGSFHGNSAESFAVSREFKIVPVEHALRQSRGTIEHAARPWFVNGLDIGVRKRQPVNRKQGVENRSKRSEEQQVSAQ